MANMTANQRTQVARVDLNVPTTGVRVAHPGLAAAFTLVAGLVAGVLVYATAVVIDGWAEAIVLGAILLTVVGAMIAVNPLRRG